MEKETIGQKLKRLRKEKGLTQKELSDLSGIHVSQLSRYEKDINVNLQTLIIKSLMYLYWDCYMRII